MVTFRAVLLTLAVLAIGFAVVLPIKPVGKTVLGIAGADLLLKLNSA